MAQFFYDIINEMYMYDRIEDMKNLYEEIYDPDTNYLRMDAQHRLIAWANEQLDLADIPKGYFRTSFMISLFEYNRDEMDAMLEHIKDKCDAEARSECGE